MISSLHRHGLLFGLQAVSIIHITFVKFALEEKNNRRGLGVRAGFGSSDMML